MYSLSRVNEKLVITFTLMHKIFVRVQPLYQTCFQSFYAAISIQPCTVYSKTVIHINHSVQHAQGHDTAGTVLCFMNIWHIVIPFIVRVSAGIALPMKHKTSDV